MATTMLTTIDNPYDPFDQFNEWLQYDQAKGYYSSEFLARVAMSSHELSDLDQELEIERAIDDIIENDVLGIYQKVKKDSTGKMIVG